MSGRTRLHILVTAAACGLYALPAMAETDVFRAGTAFDAISDPVLAELRGMAAPSSKVFVQVNDNNVASNYSAVQNGNPSSANVIVATPRTAVIGHASVGGSTFKTVTGLCPAAPSCPTVPLVRPVTIKYGVHR
jgi:hypothetical protein